MTPRGEDENMETKIEMKPPAPVVIMSGGLKQTQFGEVNEIDFDEVNELEGDELIRYCAHALSYLCIDGASDIVIDLLDAIEGALDH